MVPELAEYWQVLRDTLAARGVPIDTASSLGAVAEAAGLDVVHQGGFFGIADAATVLSLHADTLAAIRMPALASGVRDGAAFDRLEAGLRRAQSGRYDWVSSPFFLDFSFRKPVS